MFYYVCNGCLIVHVIIILFVSISNTEIAVNRNRSCVKDGLKQVFAEINEAVGRRQKVGISILIFWTLAQQCLCYNI